METVMKKIAIAAVAVLGLSIAACQDNAADNAASTENTIETEAAADTNSAIAGTENLGAAADNALDAAGNSLSNAGNAVENAADDVANGQDNVAGQ
jgi:predicted small secreted protein